MKEGRTAEEESSDRNSGLEYFECSRYYATDGRKRVESQLECYDLNMYTGSLWLLQRKARGYPGQK